MPAVRKPLGIGTTRHKKEPSLKLEVQKKLNAEIIVVAEATENGCGWP
jgi:hypothetical protein